jgi:hypothetical protein
MAESTNPKQRSYVAETSPNDLSRNTGDATSRDCEDDDRHAPFNLGPLVAILLLTLVKPICYDIVLPFISAFPRCLEYRSKVD